MLKKTGLNILLFLRRLMIHDVWGLSAQTAFFLMLAVFPLLLFLVSVINQTSLTLDYDSLKLFLPENVVGLVIDISKMAPSGGNWTLFSIIASLWSASAGIWALMRGIHRAYRQRPIGRPIVNRLLALLFTVGFAVALTVSLALSIFGKYVADFITVRLGTDSFVLTTPIRRVVTLGFIFFFLTMLYTLTPGVGGGPRRHMAGALAASGGWIFSSWVYELYMNNFNNYTAVYGSIGAFMGFMLWLLIICIIVLAGAEINAFRQSSQRLKKPGKP